MSQRRPHTAPPSTESKAQRLQPPHLPLIIVSSPLANESSSLENEGTPSPRRRQRFQPKSHTVPAPEPSNHRLRLGRPVRPLPPIPVPSSPGLTSTHGRKRTRPRMCRPLPPPPVTQQTPPTPPPETRRRTRPKISIVTSTAPGALMPLVTPLSASVPQLPTPRTAKRKQISKLSKTLGEKVPYEMMFRDSSGCVDLGQMIEVMQYDSKKPQKSEGREMLTNGKAPSYRQVSEVQITPLISETAREGSRDKGMKHLDPKRWDLYSQDQDWELVSRSDISRGRLDSTDSLLSMKWIRERGGERWVENDFDGVLQTLRKL